MTKQSDIGGVREECGKTVLRLHLDKQEQQRSLYRGHQYLEARVYQHKEKTVNGFTKRYNVTKLVYYEVYPDPASAISREKQIKAGSRRKKISLIESINKEWKDLAQGLW